MATTTRIESRGLTRAFGICSRSRPHSRSRSHSVLHRGGLLSSRRRGGGVVVVAVLNETPRDIPEGRTTQRGGLPLSRRLLVKTSAAKEEDYPSVSQIRSIPRWILRTCFAFVTIGQVVVKIFRGKIHLRNVLEQLSNVGPKSLSVSLLTSCFVGMVFTIQVRRILKERQKR